MSASATQGGHNKITLVTKLPQPAFNSNGKTQLQLRSTSITSQLIVRTRCMQPHQQWLIVATIWNCSPNTPYILLACTHDSFCDQFLYKFVSKCTQKTWLNCTKSDNFTESLVQKYDIFLCKAWSLRVSVGHFIYMALLSIDKAHGQVC